MSKSLLSLVNIPFSKRFLCLALLAIFIGLGNITLPSSQKVSGQSNPQSCATCSQPAQRTIYAPTIGLPEAGGSDIVLNCRSVHEMEAVPTFYTSEGEAIVGDMIRLQPSEIRFVSIESLIPEEHRGRHVWGGMSLSYTGMVMEVWAQITLNGAGNRGSSDVTFSVLNNLGSDTADYERSNGQSQGGRLYYFKQQQQQQKICRQHSFLRYARRCPAKIIRQ